MSEGRVKIERSTNSPEDDSKEVGLMLEMLTDDSVRALDYQKRIRRRSARVEA